MVRGCVRVLSELDPKFRKQAEADEPLSTLAENNFNDPRQNKATKGTDEGFGVSGQEFMVQAEKPCEF